MKLYHAVCECEVRRCLLLGNSLAVAPFWHGKRVQIVNVLSHQHCALLTAALTMSFGHPSKIVLDGVVGSTWPLSLHQVIKVKVPIPEGIRVILEELLS